MCENYVTYSGMLLAPSFKTTDSLVIKLSKYYSSEAKKDGQTHVAC